MNMDIRTIEIEGIEKTAISIGPDDITIPKHLMQGEKQAGIIIDSNGTKSSWYWDGISSSGGIRYVYFGKCELQDFTALSSARRSDALKIVLQIARGLTDADKSFLSLSSGIFPLNRIYIYNRDSILLLPPDLADVFSMMETDEDKHRHVTAVIRGNAEQNFMLITEMAELLYYAASGILPFEAQSVRTAGYKAVPISSIVPELDEKCAGLITFILGAKSREMRDIMGNSDDARNLSWFTERASSLEWNLGDRTEDECSSDRERIISGSLYSSFMENAGKRARKIDFWRVKGTLIIIITLAVLIGGYFIGSSIYRATRPPLTAELSKEEIIADFYQAQSDLDVQRLTTAVRGCNVPQEMEITNLYVTTRMRFAYEALDVTVDAEEWLAEGKPAIPEGSFVYGIVLDSIEPDGENRYIATTTWYGPTSYADEDSAPEGDTSAYVYMYEVKQAFEFTWNDRGWWNITNADMVSSRFLGKEKLETYTVERQLI